MRKFLACVAILGCMSNALAADGLLEVGGQRYDIKIEPRACLTGTSADLFSPVAFVTFSRMTQAGCNIQHDLGLPVNCASLDSKFLLRSFIVAETRAKNFCDCKVGPANCIDNCRASLGNEECYALCTGNCGVQYPPSK